MLEKIDLLKSVDKEIYKRVMEEEGERLGQLQRDCEAAGIPVIVVFEGMGATGKDIQINRLTQSLDPRGFYAYANNESNEEERMCPFLWKYRTKTPEKGRIAIFDRSWYRRVQVDCFDGETADTGLTDAFQDILSFEKQLSDDGIVIIKLFLHISKEGQKKRFKKLEGSREIAWRVTKRDWKRNRKYERHLKINEKMLENIDMEYASWTIIETIDKDYAAMKTLSAVSSRLAYELEKKRMKEAAPQEAEIPIPSGRFSNGVLSGMDLTKDMDKDTYKKRIDELQKKLEHLHGELFRLRIPVVLCFGGWDAGERGGAVRRLTSHPDPRGCRVNPTASPNDVEKVHHYLWRFWNNVPKAGHIAIFDRTWYGRVMVERIEGFYTEAEWKWAYQGINEMESHMANFGTVILKFWLHIDKDEQERRSKERMENPVKQWKITGEDWRNREKWDEYKEAVSEMLVRTSATYAPWIVVEGNSKYHVRVKILETVADILEMKTKKATRKS